MYPLITIIVPVYKTEQYLSRCIESIQAQTFTNFELILVNDGSPDNSGIICDNYAKTDTRIKVFHTKNKGVSSARNLGLENAQGEWITFLDSDDWIENNLFASIVKIINQYNTDLVCWNYHIDTPFESKTYTPTNYNLIKKSSKDELFNLLLLAIYPGYYNYTDKIKLDMFSIWNKAYKLSLLKNYILKFDTHLKRAEDTLFNIRYLQQIHNVVITNDCLTHYNIRPNSALTTYNPNLNSILKESALTILQNIPSKEKNITQCYLKRCIGYIYEYYQKNIWNNQIEMNKNIKDISTLCEIINNTTTNPKGNILSLTDKLVLKLIKQKSYRLLLLLLYIKKLIRR